jgi:predicted helicase
MYPTLQKSNNWQEFKDSLTKATNQEKGNAFELLTKFYLEFNPIYQSKLKNVWLWKEVPTSIKKKLNLPSNDQGIDLIAETIEGTFWAIQCKYLQEEEQRLSHRAISTFVSLSTGIANHISYCLVCTTVDDYAKIYKGNANIGFCNSDEFRKLDKTFFDWVRNKLKGKEKNISPYKPMPHQEKAIKEAKNYFIKEKNSRGKLVFPCGAGKSLTGYWITQALDSKSTLVAVPSLSLVKQTLEVYLRETVANKDRVEWLCVCSDEGIGKNDDVVVHTSEIGVPCITNKAFIADWLKKNKKNKTIIFTTYQSGKTIADATKLAKHSFDLGIMDEAHKTVGAKDKLFSHLLLDKNVKIAKRIFMTATERRYAGSSDTVLSMDDVEVYGDTFTQLSFKEAMEIGILSDYKIITLFISNAEVKNLIKTNAFVKPQGNEWNKETEARTLASLIGLRKAMTDYPIHHAVTFHGSIKKAEAFEQSQEVFSKAFPKYSKVESFTVSGAMPTSVRGKIVDEFARTNKGIITNAKCLTEGVDVPNIDCVLFADPRKSTVDIVQAVGRALRKKEGKEFGYVILPVFTNSSKVEEIIESDEFKEVLSTLRALASNDERIIEYFRDASKNKKSASKDKLISFEIDEKIAEFINEKDLTQQLELTTWNKLAKLSWMPFDEAREYVRGLGLKSVTDWNKYLKKGNRPMDLPFHPERTYKYFGWKDWGDFLGTQNISMSKLKFVDYNIACKIVKEIGVTSKTEYHKLDRDILQKYNLPSNPDKNYKVDWRSWGDFFSTGNKRNGDKQYLPFDEVKKFALSKKFKNNRAYTLYVKDNLLHEMYPATPERVYKNFGWKSWSDFLGTNRKRNIKYVSMSVFKEFIKTNNIKSALEYLMFCKSGEKPDEIPYHPERAYKEEWKGWADFLGKE